MAIPHQEIAGAFISKFYNDLCAQPGELRALYGVDSTMTCVVDAAATQLFAGQDEIAKAYVRFDFKNPRFSLTSFDSQSSGSCVIINVVGTFGHDGVVPKLFIQTFVLAPSEDTFYIKNDLLRMIDFDEFYSNEEPEQPETAYTVEEPAQVEQQIDEQIEQEIEQEEEQPEAATTPEPVAPVSPPIETPTPAPAHVKSGSWASRAGARDAPTSAVPSAVPTSSAVPAPRQRPQQPHTTLGIKNVSQNTTDETLRAVFGTVGGIKKVSRNVQKGLAFIDMDSEASVAKIIDGNTVELYSTTSRSYNTNYSGAPRGRGGMRGGFRGGVRGGRGGSGMGRVIYTPGQA